MTMQRHTCVNEAPGGSLTELLRFVRQCDLHDPRDVARRRLDSYSMWSDQLSVKYKKRKTVSQTALCMLCKYLRSQNTLVRLMC